MDRRPEHGSEKHGNMPTDSKSAEMATSATRPLSERIGTSTRALLRDILLPSSPQITLDALASTSSGTEKGDSSSSAGSTSATEASSWRSSSASCDQTHFPSQVPNETFRTSATHHDAQIGCPDTFKFDEFLASRSEHPLKSVEAPLNSRCTSQLDGNDYPKNGHNEHCLNVDAQRSVTDHGTASNNSQIHRWHSEAWQHDNRRSTVDPGEGRCDYDGAEVVALLSVPGSCLDGVPIDEGHRTQSERLDRHPQCYTAQPGEVVHPEVVANELQLVPNLGSNSAAFEIMIASMPQVDEYSQDIDLQPWLKILDSYHDEVWGDILPLVQEVRKEAMPAKDGMWKLEDKPALRRLQMLLKHLHT